MDRDPALLPGPTAQQWDTRARVALAAGGVMLLAAVVLLAIGAAVHPSVTGAFGVAALAGFVAWIVLGGRAQRRLRDEMHAGYSTMVDAAGYDLRDPVTGALQRDRTQPPAGPARRRSFLLDNLRIKPDTWVDRQREPDERREADAESGTRAAESGAREGRNTPD
jgi:hypothetical protein